MPSIKLLFKPSASGDSSQRDIITAIKSQTSNRVIPRAVPMRDGNGKLIGVLLNLPVSISGNDLAVAIAAVNANQGVSYSSKFPVESPDNFNGLVQDTTVTSLGSGSQVINLVAAGAGVTEWEGAAASESLGGTGSALRLTDQTGSPSATQHITTGEIIFDGPSNGIALITACELSGAIKLSPTISGVSCDVGNREFANMYLLFGGETITVTRYAKGAQYVNPPVDQWISSEEAGLGIAPTDWLYFKITIRADGTLVFSYSADGVTYDLGGALQLTPLADTQMKVSVTLDDQFNSASTCLQQAVVIDNLKFQVLDGNLI